MSKRRNENGQMRREEYEAEEDRDPREDDTVAGYGMTRASETEISKRRIVVPKGKRPAPAVAPAAAPASSNPFSGFTGLTQAAPAPSANPFSGFTGLTNPTPAAKPVVAAQTPVQHTPLSDDWIKAKTSGLSRDAALGAVMEVLNKEFFAFVSQQVVENPMTFWNGAVQDYIRQAHELEAKVTALHAPVKKMAPPAPPTGFSFGAAPTTSSDKPSTGFSFGAAPTSTTTTTTGFSFGAAAPSATTSSPAKPATTTGFSFGASATPASPAKPATTIGFSFGAAAPSATTTGFSFSSSTTPASPAKPATTTGFSFGTTTTSSPATSALAATASLAKPTSGFSFGAAPAPAASSAFASTPASFSFGGAAAPAASSSSFSFNLPKAVPAPAATEDEDDENIGREEATVIIKSSSEADETVVYEVDELRIRHFKAAEKRWADIGKHPFKILQNNSTKAARILSRNSIGKIMINAALYKGLKVTVAPNKKGVMLTLLHEGEPTSMLLGIAADRVEELKAAIEGACPQ
ncbi:hypothetical protein SDRG_10190 [Saprolegnia diclina VS20]|uniref:RanBD1 domain-containing protein n=1 Tax=Saprolegnia diclina (strain VS20) TaxID=1156394 RepID=T0QEL3_SAPDV|nr:hypothetical protein SDRG_10190 [Saprolegnia diclina VS20]EQC31990.1 hypothetical protein SDRG_10190 [Saprolegnia diclina VS20]|eukprot:XP_008614392.1 hypothetical protein SDRG_10190 [Saprolegnia diclina VS20]